ncbi:Cu2+-exporting ATPase [Sinorhizobium meliloti]|nr:Cu2+-exporting ATPase [Sinorhizobium meliloti]
MVSGTSDLDRSVNGESEPISVSSGDAVEAGTLNLTGPLVLRATANARNSFLAEIMGLMEAAEGGRALSRCHPPRG